LVYAAKGRFSSVESRYGNSIGLVFKDKRAVGSAPAPSWRRADTSRSLLQVWGEGKASPPTPARYNVAPPAPPDGFMDITDISRCPAFLD